MDIQDFITRLKNNEMSPIIFEEEVGYYMGGRYHALGH